VLAARLHQRSLDIKEEFGDQAGMANIYHQLGILAQDAEAGRLVAGVAEEGVEVESNDVGAGFDMTHDLADGGSVLGG
jgi:hypothetical protein